MSNSNKLPVTISKGSIPNQVGFSRVHFIITSEGELKGVTIRFDLKCQ